MSIGSKQHTKMYHNFFHHKIFLYVVKKTFEKKIGKSSWDRKVWVKTEKARQGKESCLFDNYSPIWQEIVSWLLLKTILFYLSITISSIFFTLMTIYLSCDTFNTFFITFKLVWNFLNDFDKHLSLSFINFNLEFF